MVTTFFIQTFDLHKKFCNNEYEDDDNRKYLYEKQQKCIYRRVHDAIVNDEFKAMAEHHELYTMLLCSVIVDIGISAEWVNWYHVYTKRCE